MGTGTSQIANAYKELPAAVPVDSCQRGFCLFFTSSFIPTGTKQDREGALQELGGLDEEEWSGWISAGQERMGVEPVFCAGGIYGVRPTVRGEGKKLCYSVIYCVAEVINYTLRNLGGIELVVNGSSNRGWKGFIRITGTERNTVVDQK